MIEHDSETETANELPTSDKPNSVQNPAHKLIARYKDRPDKIDKIKRHDYVSKGLSRVRPDRLFPNLEAGNPFTNDWEFLRQTVPHIWYVDSRFPQMGYLSRDEAAILYNTALRFKGKRALEIGCWRGWSTAHLLKAGVVLDVIDIVLEDDLAHKELEEIAAGLKAGKRISFHPGTSEANVATVAAQNDEKWSLIFIDGDHETPAPAQDAELCARYAADDALIVFHDLASPAVSAGLEVLQNLGWNTRIYQTMQVIGVAWRGDVEPVDHKPDPAVNWEPLDHLARFQLINESDAEFKERAVQSLVKLADQSLIIKNLTRNVGDTSLTLNELGKAYIDKENALSLLHQSREADALAFAHTKRDLTKLIEEKEQQVAERDQQVAERDQQVAERNQQVAELEQQVAERDQQVAERNQQVAELEQQVAELERPLWRKCASKLKRWTLKLSSKLSSYSNS